MADWTVKHRLRADNTLIGTFKPEALKFTLNDGEPHVISYDISLGNPGVFHDFVGPYRTTFELWRDTTQIMGGLHTLPLNITTKDQAAHISGKDWLHDLERRHFPFDARDTHAYDHVINSPHVEGVTYQANQVDVALILKNILDKVYAMPYSLALTYPTLTTNLGIPINYQLALADDSDILSIVSGLSDNYPGFHFEVLNSKELRLYSPHKYDIAVANDQSLANHIYTDAASGLLDVDFTNAGPEGTHIFGQGAGYGGSPKIGSTLGALANQGVYGRLDLSVDFGDIPSRALVESRTRARFGWGLQPVHEITIDVDPGAVGDSFWTLQRPGEAIWVNTDLYAHYLDSPQEIVSVDVTVDEEGNESATMALNQIYIDNANVGVPQA